MGVGLPPGRLGGEQLSAYGRQPVVTAQSAVYNLLEVNLDQPVPAQTLKRRVKVPAFNCTRPAEMARTSAMIP